MLELQIINLFTLLHQYYNPQWLLHLISEPIKDGFSFINLLLILGFYDFIKDVAVQMFEFKISTCYSKVTLLHLVAKYRRELWQDSELKHIEWIVKHSDCFARNNMGSTPLQTAYNVCNINLLAFKMIIIASLTLKVRKQQLKVIKSVSKQT